jgi:hypothetical protein
MYSSSKLLLLVSSVTAIMPCLGQVRSVEGMAGVNGGFSCTVANLKNMPALLVLSCTMQFASPYQVQHFA